MIREEAEIQLKFCPFCGSKLDTKNYIAFPVDVGDTVFYISVRSAFGGVISSGIIVERKVDALQYDGRIKIISYRPNENDACGNLYEYYGDLVFSDRIEAERRLEELRTFKSI